jgi:hypothetical protein
VEGIMGQGRSRPEGLTPKVRPKVVFLGPSLSGKSTTFWHIQMLFSKTEWSHQSAAFQPVIRKKFAQMLGDIAELSVSNNIITDKPLVQSVINAALKLKAEVQSDPIIPAELLDSANISAFFNDASIPLSEFNAPQFASFSFFRQNYERILAADYQPTEVDVLSVYLRSTGIDEHHLTLPTGETLILSDIGGAQPERRKWIHTFSPSSVIVFFLSLGDYDTVVDSEPFFDDALKLLEKQCDPHLNPRPIFLALTKLDVLDSKLPGNPFGNAVPEYEGANTVNDIVGWITAKFYRLRGTAPRGDVILLNPLQKNDVEHFFDKVSQAALEYLKTLPPPAESPRRKRKRDDVDIELK